MKRTKQLLRLSDQAAKIAKKAWQKMEHYCEVEDNEFYAKQASKHFFLAYHLCHWATRHTAVNYLGRSKAR